MPIPIVYGKCRVGGNIIIQNFLDDKKRTHELIRRRIRRRDTKHYRGKSQRPKTQANLDGCSYTVYRGTSTQARDSRHPAISSELSAKGLWMDDILI